MSGLRGTANRAALLCVAAALLLSAAVLASATALVRDRLPSGWPRLGADRVWLDRETISGWRAHDWWPLLVSTALAVLVALLVSLALLQLRSGRLRELPLGQPGVTLTGTALASVMADRARTIDGVARAHVRLLGRPRRLRARITLVLDPGSSPEAVLRRLARDTIAEARAATAPRTLEADVRITTRTHRAQRLR
ncbi:hypothetical protein AB0B50_01965 [Streptomyces sp. NPDC041068]|uniref:hypothetical protein n=1 Tax=Streptomyces sp. NPDC041068 TaxID=3155130 RepID=UPI0033E3D8E2